ncbi:gamma-glutamyltranspeptidase [Agrobacterium vitis]|uniref:gamma-glutamyltransferase family protein n=1 Tax=Agrobacterium vitis TaxID=373 RepID=UPI0015D6EE2B|nr:gamma-glutamyltransferase [Agrobacterium vitis]BCH59220.1 gamma-glutamyltranspeptidase [Agrobacterium vitis]
MAAFSTRPVIMAHFGAVSSTHYLASAVGMKILEQGGNAFDAAAAGAFVLQAVLPEFNGIAGECVTIFKPKESEVRVLCGQGVSGAAASITAVKSLGISEMPARGLLAAVTPGCFDSWMLLLRDYGTISVREALESAIFYAKSGCSQTVFIKREIKRLSSFFEREWPANFGLISELQPDSQGLGNRNLRLAQTLELIIQEAESVGSKREAQIERARWTFRQGFVAEEFEKVLASPVAHTLGGDKFRALLSINDFVEWEATYEDPCSYSFGDYNAFKPGPWTQGPVFLQQLALLNSCGNDLRRLDEVSFLHVFLETTKLAFADRDAYYGDPNFCDVRLTDLLSTENSNRRAALIGKHAIEDQNSSYGPVSPIEEHIRSLQHDPLGADPKATNTTSIIASDKFGNIVAATQSGGTVLESPIIDSLGIALSVRGCGFSLVKGHPNSLAPRKRPRTTLSPTLLLSELNPSIAIATPGADQQEQWQMLFFLRHLYRGFDMQEALDAPTVQTEHLKSSFPPFELRPLLVTVEPRIGTEIIEGLKEKGHMVRNADHDWRLGSVSAISRTGSLIRAAACPRRMMVYAVGR